MKEKTFLSKKILSVFGIIAIMTVASCSSGKKGTLRDSEPEGSSDENVEIISNSSAGLWEGEKTPALKEDLSIGKEYGEDHEMFVFIRNIAFDGEDNIFVADSYELTVKVFDGQGNFIKKFGREGNGPGEFQTLDDIHWCPSDNLLYITDRRNNRIAQFSREGTFIKAFKTTKFRIRVQRIDSYGDGKFILSGMRFGGDFADYRIILVDHSFENVLAECGGDFPVHSVGMDLFPDFSDVGIISGTQLYYTSPSAYEIVLLDQTLKKSKIIKKSNPKMFIPQYVRGFYSDFNGIENIAQVGGNYVVGISYTNVEEIPLCKEKMELIDFVDNRKDSRYQLDLFDSDFRFLADVTVPSGGRLAGTDSKGRIYFIQNEPFPRLVRCRLITE